MFRELQHKKNQISEEDNDFHRNVDLPGVLPRGFRSVAGHRAGVSQAARGGSSRGRRYCTSGEGTRVDHRRSVGSLAADTASDWVGSVLGVTQNPSLCAGGATLLYRRLTTPPAALDIEGEHARPSPIRNVRGRHLAGTGVYIFCVFRSGGKFLSE